jgi:hypothetical protein
MVVRKRGKKGTALGQRHEWDDIIQRGIKEMVYEDAD